MKLSLTLVGLGYLSSQVLANREGDIIEEHLGKRTAVGNGCTWCSAGPWRINDGSISLYKAACATYEYSAVASSMRNP
ncbi:hypothetical protein HYFRA_00012997 [Hymenoscyphus fraxineus]|uniref:Uncharacterized protein n=1 Tax=Hymenoscyphus fraxineus TaxID=746836 RepID=A0A9N9PM32_9HELO|nr:hypothetical protein HYFRA_00012997 [Hymenoscyphus fraxineus]